MTEGLASVALLFLAICVLIVGVVILFFRKDQALALDFKGFGISVRLKRESKEDT